MDSSAARRLPLAAGLLSVALAFAGSLRAQTADMREPQVYRQNFDQLAFADRAPLLWLDDETIPGWFASYSAAATGPGSAPGAPEQIFRSHGQASGTRLYAFGNSADLALGALPGASNGHGVLALRLVNRFADRTLVRVRVAFAVEQWRAASAEERALEFFYAVSPTPRLHDPRDWTPVPAGRFVAPVNGVGGPLDGNLPANRGRVEVTLTGIRWEPGKPLWLRWENRNISGGNHGLALDDVEISAE